MRKATLAGIVFALAYPSLATGADLPAAPVLKAAPAPVFNWSGWYGGLSAGYGWDPNYVFVAPGFNIPLDLEPKGGVFGAQLGYNWQYAPQWLAGIEADLQWSGIKGSAFYSDPAGGIDALSASVNLQAFATLRGRLGYVSGPSLLYVTGGAALGNFDTRVDVVFDVGTGLIDENKWKLGYVVGAGYEYFYAAGWTLKLEYLFMGFSFDADGVRSNNGDLLVLRADPQIHIVRFGLNKKFGL
jgi:outer membrane immunogenic protein